MEHEWIAARWPVPRSSPRSPGLAALRRALERDDPAARAGRRGAVAGLRRRRAGRRRLVTIDRRGHLIAACRWREDGTLAWAKCLTGDGDWIGIEPGGGRASARGASRIAVWLLDPDAPWEPREALTLFQAVDYERPDASRRSSQPARLPPGAGTAVLNLIAGLMKDQGVARVRYRGPYPTEQLFTALLECFRHDPALRRPLAASSTSGDLDWLPAPHERHWVAPGVSVQLRHGSTRSCSTASRSIGATGRAVTRREPRVVREEGDRASSARCGRSAARSRTGSSLDRTGEVLERARAARRSDARPRRCRPLWAPALAELIARESAPALAAALRRNVMRALALEWGAVPGDLLRRATARACA